MKGKLKCGGKALNISKTFLKRVNQIKSVWGKTALTQWHWPNAAQELSSAGTLHPASLSPWHSTCASHGGTGPGSKGHSLFQRRQDPAGSASASPLTPCSCSADPVTGCEKPSKLSRSNTKLAPRTVLNRSWSIHANVQKRKYDILS